MGNRRRGVTRPIIHAWQLEAHYLSVALANIVYTLSPQRIILGGGVMRRQQLFPLIRKNLMERLNNYVRPDARDRATRARRAVGSSRRFDISRASLGLTWGSSSSRPAKSAVVFSYRCESSGSGIAGIIFFLSALRRPVRIRSM